MKGRGVRDNWIKRHNVSDISTINNCENEVTELQ